MPDLIVLDRGLPASDSFVVIERLLTNLQLAMIPIVVVSARDVRINRRRALQAGAKAFVAKRWDDHNLRQVISDVLHGKIPAVIQVA
ncbi:MAG: response regulator [Gemmatimonadaceae bacterium]|nr:response regulator [Gemmatimonadaceae bacterium]